jgi:hypothetical protein
LSATEKAVSHATHSVKYMDHYDSPQGPQFPKIVTKTQRSRRE